MNKIGDRYRYHLKIPYRCKACNWEGYFPHGTKVEKKDGDITWHKWLDICPECNNEVKIIEKK